LLPRAARKRRQLQISLSEEQRAAVREAGNAWVVACPGSGKTRVALAKVLREAGRLKMKPSGSVLALSFSVTAKEELEARIAAHAGPTIRANITVATIHGFCLGELVVPFGSYVAGRDLRLALPGSSAYDGAVSLTAAAFGIAGPQVQAFLKFRRRIPDGRSVKAGEESAPEIHRVVAAFWEKLLGSGYVDYPNALYIALQILRSREWIRQGIAARYPFLVVDEYQDCTDIQVAIIGELVKTGSRVFLVGDLYQCVYGFAGADADSLKAFATDIGARQLTLRGSHRCPQQVIDIAERVASPARGSRGASRP